MHGGFSRSLAERSKLTCRLGHFSPGSTPSQVTCRGGARRGLQGLWRASLAVGQMSRPGAGWGSTIQRRCGPAQFIAWRPRICTLMWLYFFLHIYSSRNLKSPDSQQTKGVLQTGNTRTFKTRVFLAGTAAGTLGSGLAPEFREVTVNEVRTTTLGTH